MKGHITKEQLSDSLKNELEQIESKTRLEITAINQSTATGDCILLKTKNGKNIIIDTGAQSSWAEISTYINKLSKIDMLIITHYHLDHIGNLENVLKICDSDTKILLPAEPDFSRFKNNGGEFKQHTQNVYNLCSKYNLSKIIATENLNIYIDDVKFRFMNCSTSFFDNYYDEESEFHPGETDYNNFSLVTELTHNNNKILLSSDISSKAQEILLPLLQKYNLVQAPHHSVDSVCCREFIEKIKADMVFCCSYYITSVYRSNFGVHHMIRNVPFYVTNFTAHIKIVSDGFNLHCDNKPLFKKYNNKEVMKGFGAGNCMYYTFTDIDSGYNEDTTLGSLIDKMSDGSVAYVMFTHGYKSTPSFVTNWDAGGVIMKLSLNRATLFIHDGTNNGFNFYIGRWFKPEGDDVTWNKLTSQKELDNVTLEKNLKTFYHVTQLEEYGINNKTDALNFIKKMPPGSLYEGNAYVDFASDKLSSYAGIVKITKLSNNVVALIELYDGNPNNNKKYIGKYHADAGDFIKWYSVDMTTI